MRKTLFPVALALIIFAGCSSDGNDTKTGIENAETSSSRYSYDSLLVETTASPAAEYLANGAAVGGESQPERKIVKNAELSMSVKNFDETVDSIKSITEINGGYTENYSYSSYIQNGTEYKTGNISLRVPPECLDYVIAEIKLLGKLASFSCTADDLSDSYYDIERRLEMKLTEEKQLLNMISKAQKIEDLIELEKRLSDIRTSIESYKSRLVGIDRQAEYSTISIELSENPDEKIRQVSDNLMTRIANSFKASVNGITGFFETILVLLAGLVLPLAVIAIPVAAGIIIYKRINRRRK